MSKYEIPDALFEIFGMKRVNTAKPTAETVGKHREKTKMTKPMTKAKPTLGWGFYNAKGQIISDVFSKKDEAIDSAYNTGTGFKLVRVQIYAHKPKKK